MEEGGGIEEGEERGNESRNLHAGRQSKFSREREREFRAIFKRIDRTWLDHPTKDKDQVDRDDMSIFSKCWVGIRTLALREGRLC